MKGLTCSIYQSKSIGNCSNNGISARFNEVTLLGIKRLTGDFEPIEGVFEISEKAPPVIIEERGPFEKGELYYSAYLCDNAGNRLKGHFMAGGCFIKTCDSRFPFDYPISLHDRQE